MQGGCTAGGAQPWLGWGVGMIVTRPLLVLALALVALMAAAPSADARRKVPHGFFGTMWGGSVANAPDEVQEEQWALMARTGVESVRTVFSWSDAQSTPDAPPNFERTDRVVRLAAARGMQLLPVVIETPPWARAFDHPASPPRSNADLAAYLTALVGRYGPNGSFWTEYPVLPKRPIRTWQLYNEPHLPYWHAERGSPYAWPRGYVALLKAGRRALRSADRRAKVVLAGLTNDSWNHLLRLYRRGARRHFDIAAIQTYSGSPRRAMRAIFLFRRPCAATATRASRSGPQRRAGRRRRRMRVPRGEAARHDRPRHGVAADPDVLDRGERQRRRAAGWDGSSGTRGARRTAPSATSSTSPGSSRTSRAASRGSRRCGRSAGWRGATKAALRTASGRAGSWYGRPPWPEGFPGSSSEVTMPPASPFACSRPCHGWVVRRPTEQRRRSASATA